MNPFPYQRFYNILWALERILEVDYNFNLRDPERYQLYHSLSLAIVRLVKTLILQHLGIIREGQERIVFFEPHIPEVNIGEISSDSDNDVPDLEDIDGNIIDR